MNIITGKVWNFGDNIDTDLIIAARYLNSSDPHYLAKYVMEDADPQFATKVQPGDIIVAGENFGCGSSREHAPIALKAAGVSAIVAKSFVASPSSASASSYYIILAVFFGLALKAKILPFNILTIIGVGIVLLLIHWQLALFILLLNPFVIIVTTKINFILFVNRLLLVNRQS